MTPSDPLLGIVIPTLDEEEFLPLLLEDLGGIPIPHRVVVSDGGSTDRTPTLVQASGATLIQAPRGRARQMNAGAEALETPWLLFLHADSRLPGRSADALARWLEEAGEEEVGTFSFAVDAGGPGWRLLEVGQKVRERLLGLAYGDQGLLVHRTRFLEVGGFPDTPLMEDVEILRLLRRRGRWRRIPSPLVTDPRRFREEGILRGWLRNALLISLFLVGVPQERLARRYRPRRSPVDKTLLVFAKAPEPGRVKTRLAQEVGEEAAAEIYSVLARRVVARVKGGSYRTEVCFTPPDALSPITTWLGQEGLTFHPQVDGDLGTRLHRAIERALEESQAVSVVGTDAPDVGAGLVEEAFAELERVDLVLGPAQDGGYYLIAMKEPRPGLFQGIPWSTEQVLEATLERARSLGLRSHLLPPLRDVDTLEDWLEVEEGLSSWTGLSP